MLSSNFAVEVVSFFHSKRFGLLSSFVVKLVGVEAVCEPRFGDSVKVKLASSLVKAVSFFNARLGLLGSFVAKLAARFSGESVEDDVANCVVAISGSSVTVALTTIVLPLLLAFDLLHTMSPIGISFGTTG